MKKNIIFALFSAFVVIAIAIGFYMQWNPIVVAILLGVFFVGTICYLIGICRHLIMSRVISCKERIDKAYRKYIRKIAVNCSRKVNRWKLEDTGENHISLLSPIDDFKRHKEYIIRLKNAIDQPNVFNIALTGLSPPSDINVMSLDSVTSKDAMGCKLGVTSANCIISFISY